MPLRLYIIEWRTGKEYSVFNSDTFRGPLTWTGQHTLLFGALTTEQERLLKQHESEDSKKEKTEPTNQQELQPNIYEFTPEKGKPSLLFKDGFRPVASLNGELIAFFGNENPAAPIRLQEG